MYPITYPILQESTVLLSNQDESADRGVAAVHTWNADVQRKDDLLCF